MTLKFKSLYLKINPNLYIALRCQLEPIKGTKLTSISRMVTSLSQFLVANEISEMSCVNFSPEHIENHLRTFLKEWASMSTLITEQFWMGQKI